jgi:hypothetical protein
LAKNRVFQVTAQGDVWEELPGDLRFIGSFGDQASGIAEARREATLAAPAIVVVLSADGTRRQVIEVNGT